MHGMHSYALMRTYASTTNPFRCPDVFICKHERSFQKPKCIHMPRCTHMHGKHDKSYQMPRCTHMQGRQFPSEARMSLVCFVRCCRCCSCCCWRCCCCVMLSSVCLIDSCGVCYWIGSLFLPWCVHKECWFRCTGHMQEPCTGIAHF